MSTTRSSVVRRLDLLGDDERTIQSPVQGSVSIVRKGGLDSKPSESVASESSQPQTQIGLHELKQEGEADQTPLPPTTLTKQSSIISLAEFGDKTNVRELAKTYSKPSTTIKGYIKLFRAEVDTKGN